MSSTGIVKTFGAQKGFGFIECADVDGDVYFAARDLPAELQGQDLRLTGCTVYFELSHRPDGKPQGKQVQVEGMELEMLSSVESSPGVNLAAGASYGGGADDMVSGEVKSFNDMKGFGFLSSPMVEGDVYFQKRDVPPHLQGLPVQGYKVEFALHETPDGKFQARKLRFVQTGGCGKGACNGGFAKGGKPGKGWPQPSAPIGPGKCGGKGGFKGEWGAWGGWGDGCGKGGFKGAPPAWGCGGYKGATAAFGSAPPAAAAAHADGAMAFGTVKQINEEKGFGFITAPGLPSDVYFKVDGTVETGMNVSFTLKWMRDGKPQARDIAPALAGGETLLGIVKSFSEKNSYGFITSEESTQDIWFHQRALPEELQALTGEDLRGMTLRFSVQLKPDGKPQAQDIVPVDGMEDVAPPPALPPPRGTKRPAEFTGWGAGTGAPAPVKVARIAPSITPGKGAAYGKGSKGAKGAKAAAAAIVDDAGAEAGNTAAGFIKSFNAQKGFGFIESPEVEGDIYFKSTMLPPHLQAAPLQGSEVNFELRYTPDGKPQAGRIQVDGM